MHAIALAGRDEREVLLERVVTSQQRGRRRAERGVELAHHHLVQVAVVDPYLLAVTDDQLFERFVVRPAELARAPERERTRRCLRRTAVLLDDHLAERPLRALRAFEKRVQLVETRSGGRACRERECGDGNAAQRDEQRRASRHRGAPGSVPGMLA